MTTTDAPIQLEPPLVLEAPKPVAKIEPEKSSGMVRLPVEVLSKLDAQIDDFVSVISQLDPHSEAFQTKVKTVYGAGDAEVQQAASMSNRMLERPMRTLQKGGVAEGSSVSQSLLELRRTVEDLDPSKQGDLFTQRKIFGLIPFGNKIEDYFDRYSSSQDNIQKIIQALYNGRDELERDNAAIEEEKLQMWNVMQRIEQYLYVLKGLDKKLEQKAIQLDGADAAKAKVLREDVLFYVRQKVTDLLTQMAVNAQGYMALDLIRKTNLELIKGVQRATTTTVSALRTAVMVAQALNNQKLVLDQITALNTTTGNMIEATSKMLKEQSGRVFEQSANATIEVEKLKRAFQNIYDTMDAVSDFKTKALGNMAQTVETLSEEVTKAKTYMDKIRQGQAAEATAGLNIKDDGIVTL